MRLRFAVGFLLVTVALLLPRLITCKGHLFETFTGKVISNDRFQIDEHTGKWFVAPMAHPNEVYVRYKSSLIFVNDTIYKCNLNPEFVSQMDHLYEVEVPYSKCVEVAP